MALSEEKASNTTLEEAVKKGDAQSMCELAERLRKGAAGSKKDPQRAVALYRQAMKEDASFDAAANLAFMLECGKEVPKDSNQAFQILYDALHEEGFEGYNAEEAFRFACNIHGTGDADRAIALLQKVVVKGGNVQALSSLGSMVERGLDNVPGSASRAVELYELAVAHGGEVEAMHNLANILMGGRDGVEPNYLRAVTILSRAVDEYGKSEDMCELAGLLRSGRGGVPLDPERAVALYKRAAIEDQHPRAIMHLAFMMARGVEVTEDAHRAGQLLLAAVSDCDEPFYTVVDACGIIAGDDDVPMDPAGALELLKQAISESGIVEAMNGLARTLVIGAPNIPADPTYAAVLYERAIDEEEDAEAMRRLARLLTTGAAGIPIARTRAEALLRRAISIEDSPDDICSLAELLRSPRGDKPADPAAAVALYERAADGGHVEAQAHLAFMLDAGEEVPQDAERAERLLASAIGDSDMADVHTEQIFASIEPGGGGGPGDSKRARMLLQRVVEERGNAYALRQWASILEAGAEGVGQDPAKAAELYKRAVEENDNVDAMHRLAAMLKAGRPGVPADPKKAEALLAHADSITLTGGEA